jgi:hypothetical protein
MSRDPGLSDSAMLDVPVTETPSPAREKGKNACHAVYLNSQVSYIYKKGKVKIKLLLCLSIMP